LRVNLIVERLIRILKEAKAMRQTYTKSQEEIDKEARNYREYVNAEALKVLIKWKLAAGEISFS
jgi:hypothetical protein